MLEAANAMPGTTTRPSRRRPRPSPPRVDRMPPPPPSRVAPRRRSGSRESPYGDGASDDAPGMIYARYLRSGRWVPIRIGSLSLKGAALMAVALPRVDDRVDIALAFGKHRALVRGTVAQGLDDARRPMASGATDVPASASSSTMRRAASSPRCSPPRAPPRSRSSRRRRAAPGAIRSSGRCAWARCAARCARTRSTSRPTACSSSRCTRSRSTRTSRSRRCSTMACRRSRAARGWSATSARPTRGRWGCRRATGSASSRWRRWIAIAGVRSLRASRSARPSAC